MLNKLGPLCKWLFEYPCAHKKDKPQGPSYQLGPWGDRKGKFQFVMTVSRIHNLSPPLPSTVLSLPSSPSHCVWQSQTFCGLFLNWLWANSPSPTFSSLSNWCQRHLVDLTNYNPAYTSTPAQYAGGPSRTIPHVTHLLPIFSLIVNRSVMSI